MVNYGSFSSLVHANQQLIRDSKTLFFCLRYLFDPLATLRELPELPRPQKSYDVHRGRGKGIVGLPVYHGNRIDDMLSSDIAHLYHAMERGMNAWLLRRALENRFN